MRRKDLKPPPELTVGAANDLVKIMDAMLDILEPLPERMESLWQILERYEPGSKRAKFASLFVDDARGNTVSSILELEQAISYLTRENDKGLRVPK